MWIKYLAMLAIIKHVCQ